MDIIKSIRLWVRNRNIHTAHPRDQYLKVVEEVGELAAALARANMELIKDSVGDIVVTLVALCETMDIDFNECVRGAYDEIKDRKGKLNEQGIFVKE